MAEPAIETLRVASDRRRADEWALALASAGIDSRIDPAPEGAVVVVRAADRARATAVLAAYDAENRPTPLAVSDDLDRRISYAAAAVAVLLCGFFAITGSLAPHRSWFERGMATASRIAAGEVWRTVTALTLHADVPHIASNALTLIIFGTALCSILGSGTGLWVMLLSGAAGNWFTALLRGAPHSALGASTGIFGGVGALAAVQLVRRRRGAAIPLWRASAPIAAGLALLAVLGTAPESDVIAHLFGFALGAGFGIVALRLQHFRQRPGVQAALCLAAALAVVGCWLLALR